MRRRSDRMFSGTTATLVVAATTALAGCGGASPTGGDADFQARRRLSTVASFYGDYLSEHGAPPKDDAAFRAFLQERSQGIERMDVGGVDGLLTSPRDDQPFVVIYGKRIAPADSPNTPWAVYEQTGVDGKHLAAQVRGQVVELTDAEIASQLTAPPK